jgi:ATP-dependent protease HslVU (ClpYQ) peptidase subunit
LGARFGGAEGLRKYCRQEAVVAPRTNIGAGGNYYNNSAKALKRMNKLMTRLALRTPRRASK